MNLNIAENIKRLRIENNLTQAELADCLSVSPQAVSRWENDQAYPDIELLAKLADYFNVSVDELMGREISKTLSQKYEALYAQYHHDGAKDKDMLIKLCDMLEILCAHEPLKYVAQYFRLSKNLSNITYTNHLSNAKSIAISLFSSAGAQSLNSLLLNIAIREDENGLKSWERYITNSTELSTWNDILLARYFAKQDPEKWEKTRQEILYNHLNKILHNLVNGMPKTDSLPTSATVPVEYCNLAFNTLSLYSNDAFDIFFPVRFRIEIKLTLAYFNERNFEAGFEHLSILRKYAEKLHEMLEEKTVRRGSVPALSLIEIKTAEFEESVVNEFLLCEKRTLPDEVRNDERFISALQEFKSLFDSESMEMKIRRRMNCNRRLLRDVLKYAAKDLSKEDQEILAEHFNRTENGSDKNELRKIEAFRAPNKNNLPKASVKDFVKLVHVKMPNEKNNITFTVTVKYGYLQSIISSECEENLPMYVDKYEIVKESRE